MTRFAEQRDLDVWYAHLDVEAVLPQIEQAMGSKQSKTLERNLAKAHTKDSMKALEQAHSSGRRRAADPEPPTAGGADRRRVPRDGSQAARDHAPAKLLRQYRASLQNDRRVLVERFRFADAARKVVGVGSVGTRAWILLMLGRDDQDPLFLQVKEAGSSVLEPFVGASAFKNHGQRVVEGQRLMQASSDIFLGWISVTGIDGVKRDFYVRQLWDWKASADIETFSPKALGVYARMCGWTLARAHARSGDRIAIAAYLGSGTTFDEAHRGLLGAYADQNEADYATFKAAVDDGRLQAQTGL